MSSIRSFPKSIRNNSRNRFLFCYLCVSNRDSRQRRHRLLLVLLRPNCSLFPIFAEISNTADQLHNYCGCGNYGENNCHRCVQSCKRFQRLLLLFLGRLICYLQSKQQPCDGQYEHFSHNSLQIQAPRVIQLDEMHKGEVKLHNEHYPPKCL